MAWEDTEVVCPIYVQEVIDVAAEAMRVNGQGNSVEAGISVHLGGECGTVCKVKPSAATQTPTRYWS